jgi:two-component system OmpR family sensor kinase
VSTRGAAASPGEAGTGSGRARSGGRRAPWTLRRRLVVTVLALLLGTAVALALTSTLALRSTLMRQLDTQLAAASSRGGEVRPGEEGDRVNEGARALPSLEGGARGAAEPPPFLDVAGQRTGTLGMFVVDGTVQTAGYLDDAAALQTLDTAQQEALLTVPADGEARAVTVPGLGDFRVVGVTRPSGDVVYTGLSMAEAQATEAAYLATEAVVVALCLMAAGVVAAFVVRRSLRPLDRMAAAATRVSEMPLHRGEVTIPERLAPEDTDPRTEVGQVGAALNRMLGHVEGALVARHASETQVRQFVADASHELRTPLASIRGYAELVRRSPEEVPQSTRRAVERVESEATRMSALVEDLLLLARLDAGRPLAREEVDLAALAVDALTDAHAAGRDHRWRLHVPEEGAVVVGDAARLHQVLANLLGNARVHTPPGTTVDLSVVPEPGGVRLDVHDDGPGIPGDLAPVLFQRFTRGDGARNRAAGSTGLGLAIAEAVVSAHHGSLTVTSAPGSTTFAAWLPSAQSPEHDPAHAAPLPAEGEEEIPLPSR